MADQDSASTFPRSQAWLDPDRWSGRVFLGGWTEAAGGDAPVIEPATGAHLARVGSAAPADVARACALAAAAQPAWAAAPYHERAAVLRRAAALLEENRAEVEHWLVREGGKVPGAAAFEIGLVLGELHEAAALPSRPYGELIPSGEPRLSFARRVPVGVVGVIAPFNFPLILAARSLAPALALGNAVVLKPDPRTAVCGGVALARLFEAAGLPDGVLHVLPGGAQAGEALVTDPNLRVVSFTGSTAAGRRVGTLAAQHLKRAHLELGGNSALIVLDDADLERAVSAGAWGSFLHQGQICMTTGRHLVHEAVYDDYVAALAAKAEHLPVGDPAGGAVALGPLIDARQRDKVHALVTASVEAGARLVAGGTYEELFYRPTVLAEVTPDAPAYAQEVFGPVAPVTRFSTLDQAAKLASDTEYGLSLGILTRDVMRGLELAEKIPTGLVHINDQTVNDEAVAPFGGLAASGTGARFGGAAANVEAFTETRWITVRAQIAPYPF
ncbi:aldehyde dehydrogenase family protein [Actinocrinis puniceicyclus]|uniref:Aldehyde dehydrogenase family protein n=1 Tax=Actinocrinis puniceicyclus TaxID=977794 RepID=A0A8J7WMS9_9ACTN|nr:aldehyde dehydrogenase family protein [Actinocrinis puniceicyclus]MBS2963027.1 aldehyde dehydrogenase family protein [Actinocrinis puniceicyclus]